MQQFSKNFGYIFDNILKHDLQMIIAVAVIVVWVFIIWLILRGPRLWYWKIKQRENNLKDIEGKLKVIEELCLESLSKDFRHAEIGKNNSQKKPNWQDKGGAENNVVEKDRIFKEVVEENSVEAIQKNSKEAYSLDNGNKYVGKSGVIYTREQLEAKIMK